MPRNLSDNYDKLFKDAEDRETRYLNPDGKFPLQSYAGLGTSRDLSSLYLYKGNGSDNRGELQSRFYTDFSGQKRRDILHRFDTTGLVVRKIDIQARQNIPTTPAPRREDELFYEGDTSDSEKRPNMWGLAGKAAALGLGALYIYRGLRGAGWYPGRTRFWQPLAKVQRSNIISSFQRTGYIDELIGRGVVPKAGNKAFEAEIAAQAKRGFGLATAKEGVGRLFGRSVEGIPEAIEYLGIRGPVLKKARYIPRKILSGWITDPKFWKRGALPGGTLALEPGFSRATSAYRKLVSQNLAAEGLKVINPNPAALVGKVMTNLVVPAYVATLGFNYLDYRLRRSKALDETPLREGITGAAASMWVKSRMFMQKALNAVGALNLHKYLNDLMPGYLRVAGMIAGGALASRAAIKGGILKPLKIATDPLAKSIIPKRRFVQLGVQAATAGLVGGIAGYAAERGLGYEPEDLEKIYSGEQKIPVRKGRWWEFGRTPFEGGKIAYFRPHWYPMMKSRYRERGGLYPSEDWKWQHHWLIGPLTTGKFPDRYAWEKQFYKERPYPVTSGPFEGFPIIGPALDFTIGRFIKPKKLMHTEEWASGGEIAQQPDLSERVRRVPVDAAEKLGLGSIPRGGMGEVTSPDDVRNFLGEQQYRLTEWFGLPGFAIQEMIRGGTGKESLFETARLQSPERATGFERNYWDRDLGGLAGTTEIFRRFFPHRRRQVEEYNPIPNLMGKEQPWLPGPEYFIDFKHGDPFIKVPMGEARLPGGGYEALNELHSNIPGVYDAMDRFLILADVAPYSDQYKHYSAIVKMWARSGALDDKWTGKQQEALAQRQARMKRYEFYPRRFGRIKEIVESSLEADNIQKKEEPKYNAVEKAVGSAWESTVHGVSNAPIPFVSWLASKHMQQRTAVEHYERFQVFGRESSFWGHPIRDFAKVYLQEIGGKIAPDVIPGDVRKRWGIEEYFDRLKYVKYKQLESLSEEKKDYKLAKAFAKKQKETMFGLDPYGSYSNIYRAMPRRERDYFEAFKDTYGKDRERIRQLVSPDMSRLYEAQWRLSDLKAGRETDTEKVERRTETDLEGFFERRHLPGPNWLGWHPDINLDKVKLKVVKNESMDIHDFNLWEAQEREMAREPIPNIDNYAAPNPQYDSPQLRKILLETLMNRGVSNPNIEITTQPSNNPTVNIDFDLGLDQSDRFYRSVGRQAYMMS